MWSVGCREIKDATLSSCSWTGYLNNMDGEINYTVPAGYAIVGVESYHDNGAEDRRWKVNICEVSYRFFFLGQRGVGCRGKVLCCASESSPTFCWCDSCNAATTSTHTPMGTATMATSVQVRFRNSRL